MRLSPIRGMENPWIEIKKVSNIFASKNPIVIVKVFLKRKLPLTKPEKKKMFQLI